MRSLLFAACMMLAPMALATDDSDDTDTDSDSDSDAAAEVTGSGAGELAGESGGMDCNSAGSTVFALPLILVVAATTRRRKIG